MNESPTPEQGTTALKISAIICSYNRDKFIGKALYCLLQQSLSPDLYEVLIIDNNSTDQTASICKNIITENPLIKIRYFFEPVPGLSSARNRGLKEAQSDIITYIDDDAEATLTFLENIITFLDGEPAISGIGGKVIPKYENGMEPLWMNDYLNGFVGKVNHGDKPKLFTRKIKYPAGCNMTYRKDILIKAGGFNNQLTFRSDDKYMYQQVSKINDRIYYLPTAFVYHNIDSERLEFSSFKKIYLKTGNEERIRVLSENGKKGVAKKLIKFMVNLSASFLLYAIFFLKGREIKGRYIVYSQWFTLKGFLMKKVFVR